MLHFRCDGGCGVRFVQAIKKFSDRFLGTLLYCMVQIHFFSSPSPRGAHSQSVGVQVRSWKPPAPEMAPHCFLGSTSVQTQRPAAPVERLECAALERHEFAVDGHRDWSTFVLDCDAVLGPQKPLEITPMTSSAASKLDTPESQPSRGCRPMANARIIAWWQSWIHSITSSVSHDTAELGRPSSAAASPSPTPMSMNPLGRGAN